MVGCSKNIGLTEKIKKYFKNIILNNTALLFCEQDSLYSPSIGAFLVMESVLFVCLSL